MVTVNSNSYSRCYCKGRCELLMDSYLIISELLMDSYLIIEELNRTILCPPELVDDLRKLIDSYGLGKLWQIQSSEHTNGNLYIVKTDFYHKQSDDSL